MTAQPPPEKQRLGKAYTTPAGYGLLRPARGRHYAECVRGLPQVFDTTRRPWIRPDLADAQAVAEVVRRCPTGAFLCPCGRTGNEPFCDGACGVDQHRPAGTRDQP